MAVFSCPECGALSQSNREASYYWCACGRPLTAANTVPGMADAVAGETSRAPHPEPYPAPPEVDPEVAVEAEPVPGEGARAGT
jgi:hypothetical protein